MDSGIISNDEGRRKRLKVSNDDPALQSMQPASVLLTLTTPTPVPNSTDPQAVKEAEVGITNYVSTDIPGFSGIVKKRYTDFLVNEILPSGTVLHLEDLSIPGSSKGNTELKKKVEESRTSDSGHVTAPQPQRKQEGEPKPTETPLPEVPEFSISDDDRKLLIEYIGAGKAESVITLHRRCLENPKSRPSELGRVKSDPIDDKDVRTKLHQIIRRIFVSRLESTTDADGSIVFSSAAKSQRHGNASRNREGGGAARGKVSWTEVGGEYVHFSLYKENKDTMEAISFLARQMRLNPKHFGFAGTKDRRGVTVQRASVHRATIPRLAAAGKTLRNAVLGDFTYQKHKLELGDLQGNEFVITLRECEFLERVIQGLTGAEKISKASELVSEAMRNLRDRGYFNYYGLQRFGSFATRTDRVGLKMLNGDFKGACDSILHFSPAALAAAQSTESNVQQPLVSSDDMARAKAIHIFQTTGNINDALDLLPKKFTGESNVIRHLGRNSTDYFGALQTIPRNLRLMYVHAYQSYVFNFAVGERWRLYGDKVVAGDLVLVNEHQGNEHNNPAADQVDADGEVVVLPDVTDSANSLDDLFLRARVLSAEEATSGAYTVFDIVLPLPGFDIIYPPNEMTDFYKRFMRSDQGGNLDPFDMRRKWKDISLSGSYRKVLSRPSPHYSFEVKAYTDDNMQFVTTDLEKLKGTTTLRDKPHLDEASATAPEKLAVVIKFQLGASQYATMALRELMKGGARAYQPEFAAAR